MPAAFLGLRQFESLMAKAVLPTAFISFNAFGVSVFGANSLTDLQTDRLVFR